MNGDDVARVKKSQEHFEEKTDEIVKSCVGGAEIAFGTSGWRGRLGQEFVLANVQRAAQGVAEYYGRHLGRGFILIGFDPRRGNYEFAIEIASILAANNIPVKIILEEPTPTPVLAYLANSDEEISGVINLTGSHNRYTDDGFKFSPHHGGAADKETTDLISKYANEAVKYRKISYESAKAKGLIREVSLKETVDRYVNGHIIPSLKQLGAWETIVNYVKSNPNFKLISDPMQGTTVRYLEAFYRLLEMEVGRSFIEIIHIDNRDPEFTQVSGAPNPTEPDSIRGLIRLVAKNEHALGLAADGDGDRFGIIDFKGGDISGNEVIAMLTYFLAQHKLRGAIGKTVATSNFVNAVAEHLGLELVETPVGFKWFVERIVKEGKQFLVAGEESAHVGTGPFMKSWDDGIIIGIMCLWMIASTEKSLTSYKGQIETAIGKRFFYTRDNIELTQELKDKTTSLIHQAKQEQDDGKSPEEMSISQRIRDIDLTKKIRAIITLDGLKIIFDAGDWLCIRLSGTENVARLYTEVIDMKKQESLHYISKALLGVSPEKERSYLLEASGKQTKDQIPAS
jgi:phosphoglucomutase